MKVNIKMPRDVAFEDIYCGNVFYAYSGAYMKIIPLLDKSDDLYNAVNLSDGSLEYIDDDKLVQRLEGELNVSFLTE